MKLIFVHVPKSGGTSVGNALKTAYGPGYAVETVDDPVDPQSERNIDPVRYFGRRRRLSAGVECLHGHFHPGQFDLASKDTILFTMLRHPVANLMSIYFYWRSLKPGGHGLFRYFSENRLEILDLARLPLIRNLYCESYFGGFDMAQFALIGRHSERMAALSKLSSLIGRPLDTELKINITAATDARAEMEADVRLTTELTSILAKDIAFYERHAG